MRKQTTLVLKFTILLLCGCMIISTYRINEMVTKNQLMQSHIDHLEEYLRDMDSARCDLLRELQRLKDK